MKKNIIISVFLIVFSFGTNAQIYHPFPTGSATWSVVRCFFFYQPGWHDDYSFMMDGADTLHDGLLYKKINISVHHLPGTVYDSIYPTEFFGGLRESGKQIFIWKTWASADTSVKLVYDFSHTNIGDTIYTNVLTGNPNLFGHLITSKDSVLVGAQLHSRLHLQDPSNIYNTEDWIEGVGSSWGLPFATFWSATDNSYDLTCFYEDQRLKYGNPSPVYSFCQSPLPMVICDTVFTPASKPVSKDILFSLYPNPSSDMIFLNINNSNYTDLELNIYNIMGVLVSSDIIKQSQTQIDIGDLKGGIYMVEIKSKDWIKNQKLIIQR